MHVQQETTLAQRLQITQSQIQSLEILAMDNVSLNDFLQNEYMENPILDYTPVNEMPAEFEALPAWMEQTYKSACYESRTCTQEDAGQKEFVAKTQDTLKEFLMNQLNMDRYSHKEWRLVEYLIDCLDDNGFFTMHPRDVARLNFVSEDVVNRCLEDLRLLEPWGIFAGSLSECLIRQLDVRGIEDEALTKIIRFHLEDIADGKISSISRNLKLSTAQTRKYIAFIQKLNPRPLQGFYTETTPYIVPDVIFTLRDGIWEISLNERWMGDYSLNDYYINMMHQSKDSELFDYFKRSAERAHFILNSLEQRRKTLIHISSAILDYQKGFFEGKENRRPMTMNQVAELAGVHTSTVSRCIRNKYIQYGKGTILMKQLFSGRAYQENPGFAVTAEEIKNAIAQFVKAENRRQPYSDQKLMEMLQLRDIHISRRTVAKYREEMGIKKSFERKDF